VERTVEDRDASVKWGVLGFGMRVVCPGTDGVSPEWGGHWVVGVD
jgi:hypothetical protein